MSKKMVTERVDWFDDYELFDGRSFDEAIDKIAAQRDFYAEKYKHALKIYFSAEYHNDGTEGIQALLANEKQEKEVLKHLITKYGIPKE